MLGHRFDDAQIVRENGLSPKVSFRMDVLYW